MLKKVFKRLIIHRHPWRELGVNELAELYSCATLLNVAQSLVGLFIPVFLYKNGYGISGTLLFFIITYAVSSLASFPAGYLVARIGPKHTLLVSNLMRIAGLLLITGLPTYHYPLALPAIVYGVALKMYFIPYHVDFSKILHKHHGGKELAFMNNILKLANALGPLAGGAIAIAFGAQWTLITGVILFAISAAPLFASREPVTTHQHLNFQGLLAANRWRDYISLVGYSANSKVNLVLWPLFIAVAVFTGGTYGKLGLAASIGAVIALATTMATGRLVDKKRGGVLLNFGTSMSAVLHLVRPLVTGFGGVLAVNLGSQTLFSAIAIPYVRGYYDNADSLEGQRIAYITWMEFWSDFGNLALVFITWLLCLALPGKLALQAGFFVGAGFTLLILIQKFPALVDQPRVGRLLAWRH